MPESNLWVIPWLDGVYDALCSAKSEDERHEIAILAGDTFKGMVSNAKHDVFIYLLGRVVRQ